jgi:hypothetical protein
VNKSASKEDIEDWVQELLLHLSTLPQSSKYRQVGMADVVQTFSPAKHYGANQARFHNYVNLCLANKFRTLHSKSMKDALCRPNKLSIDGPVDSGYSFVDGYCQSNSPQLREATRVREKQTADRAVVRDFVHFVRRHDPKSVSMIEALLATRTQAEAADYLGITEVEFGRRRYRLNRLRRCFQTGEPVPKRRPYEILCLDTGGKTRRNEL